MFSSKVIAVASALVAVANADIYLHNMRGSNNRLDEARRDRNNANRLFDSQNNNRGGSNVGSLYFYENEKVPMEWTNQHGCGNSANDCQLVVQYMCDERLRDGVTTRTIPQTPSQCLNYDCNNDVRYGMHESYDYYMNCKYRFRNRGLFNADRNLNGNTARFTRQNNNGNRRGYECPEERDNYPYWHPTPWIDLAIYTNDPSRCDFYQAESENVKGRHFCSLPDSWYHDMVKNGGNGNAGFIPNTEARCEALNQPGTAMVVFLERKAAAANALQEALANRELRRCNDQMEEIMELCDVGLNGTSTVGDESCPRYAQIFSATGDARLWRTAADLATACPVCPAGTFMHPYSDCALCGPATCSMADFAEPVEGVCPDTFVQDNSSMWCVKPACGGDVFRARSQAQLKATDECKSDLLAENDRFLVRDVSGAKLCTKREIASIDCLVEGDSATWKMSEPHSASIPTATAPWCQQSRWSRANHLGNGIGGHTNGHNLTMPAHYHPRCALRLRYNITTKDYGRMDPHNSGLVNSSMNKDNGNNPAKVNVGANHGIATVSSRMPYRNARGYLWRNNPKVSIFDFSVAVTFCENWNLVRQVDGMNDTTWCRPEAGWAQCATEGGACACDGFVRYGESTTYTEPMAIDGTINCNNNVFGDPIPGRRKYCQCSNSAATDQPVVLSTRANSAYCPSLHPSPAYDATTGEITRAPAGDCIMCKNASGDTVAGFGCSTNGADMSVNGGLLRQNGNNNANDNSEDTDFRLQLAINTNQFGRTFQDRSHSYAVRSQPEEMKADCKRIYALNVRGKRGNVVQTFPGTEYDFVPNILEVSRGDCVHFQWTGSNTNPNNNDGQGKQGTDRSNIALLEKVRGEGGRGVSRSGGKGADGTTWTTADMEPGYEGFVANAAPTMFDLQCSDVSRRAGGNIYNVPYGGWRFCSSCNALTTAMPIKPGPTCEAGYSYNNLVGVCVKSDTPCRFEARTTNPATFAGMGVVAQDPGFQGYSQSQMASPDDMKFGSWGTSHPEHLDNVTAWMVWGLTRSQANNLATLKDVQFRGEMSELDDAGTYFDMPPHRISGALGAFYYMCTRNNNFSNRSQKGKMVVSDSVQEIQQCSAAGCDVSTADEITMDMETMNAALNIPANSIPNAMTVSVEVMVNKGLADGASDVVMIGSEGPLSTMKIAQTVQMAGDEGNSVDPTTAPGRREERRSRRDASGESGLWVWVDMPISMDKIDISLKSPNTSLLSKEAMKMDGWPMDKKVVCVSLMWAGSDGITTNFTHTAWDDVTHVWPLESANRESVRSALESNGLWVKVQFPTATDIGTCTGDSYQANSVTRADSGSAITIAIPTAAAVSYGPVYRWPATPANVACMNSGGCDLTTSDRTELEADCVGGTCTVSCSKDCDGYYQVSSGSLVPMIIGATVGALLISSMCIGSAFYFRRNPEKWEEIKAYGPQKYTQLKRSMQDRL